MNGPIRPVVGAALLAALCCLPCIASAQEVQAHALKAAFLANFAKFVEWPEDAMAPGQVFTFCVAGDKGVSAALEQTVKQYPAADTLRVLTVTPDEPLRTCQMLFLSGGDLRQARKVLESFKPAPIFTVSDIDGFAELGGVAQLKLENGKIHFLINPAAAQRARLALSAKLLSLATLVKDGPNASR